MLCVCVDDLLTILQIYQNDLANRFSSKDLRSLHFFLGDEVIHRNSQILLSKHKYVKKIVKKLGMPNAKIVATPMATNS